MYRRNEDEIGFFPILFAHQRNECVPFLVDPSRKREREKENSRVINLVCLSCPVCAVNQFQTMNLDAHFIESKDSTVALKWNFDVYPAVNEFYFIFFSFV